MVYAALGVAVEQGRRQEMTPDIREHAMSTRIGLGTAVFVLAEFSRFIQSETAKWSGWVKSLGITVD